MAAGIGTTGGAGGTAERRRAGARLAVATLSFVLAGAAAMPAAAGEARDGRPRTPDSVASAAPQLAQSEIRDFDIASQPLATALLEFARESGVELFFDDTVAQGVETTGLRGSFTREEALRRLLAGSGLVYRFTNPSTVTVERAPEDGAIALGPIVVTGEKVRRSYLETYSSVGIATQEDIETYGVGDLHEAFENMANVRAFPSNQGNNGFQIRGMNADGVTQPANAAPLISVIIDGVTQSAEGLKRGARGTWDVEQIEVLRGPQSTLQGRNALAGAVIVETNDPSWDYEFALKGGAGERDRREGAFMLSGPIVRDEVAFRVSGEKFEERTDIHFSDPANEPLAEDRYFNLRGKLLLAPDLDENLSVLLTGSHTYDSPTARPVTGPDFFAREYGSAATFTEFREMHVDNYGLDASYDLGDGFVLRSLTAYNDTDLAIRSAPASATYTREEHRRDGDFTQDVRLELEEELHGFSGVAGLFYGYFDQQVDSYIEAAGAVFQDGTFRNRTKTVAGYADLRYRVIERVHLIGGGRYQHDGVRNLVNTDSAFGASFSDREASFEVFLPKAGIAYELAPTQTVAATATRGYRQGFTELQAGTASTVNEVEPEFIWTYELAYRLTSPDNRLTAGANVFYSQYKDHQITVVDPALAPLSNTRNAGDSRSWGAEIEGRYDFANGFTVFGTLGLLKTEFGDFEDTVCAPSGGDCEGNSYPEAPAITAAIGGAYRHASGLFAAATTNYTDEYYAWGEINNRPQFEIESRFLVDARAGFATDHTSITLYVENVFDKQYITGRSTTGSSASIGDGRTVGVEMRAQF